MIEKTTGLNFPIAMATGNKLRPKKTCSLTYNINGLISPSEAKLTTNYLKKIHDLKILIVNSLTSDAIAQISNVVKKLVKR